MQIFQCSCAERPLLYFENTACCSCNRLVGFCPNAMMLKPFTPVASQQADTGGNLWKDDQGREYVQCRNWTDHGVCNWMLSTQANAGDKNHYGPDNEGLCPACRLNDIIPDLTIAANLPLWASVEKAKRRCLFTLLELKLPVSNDSGPSGGLPLTFNFMSDKHSSGHFQKPIKGQAPVMTGHDQGTITLNLAEADDIARTQARIAMQERYRTLLGHFRHEIGHYYWDIFKIQDPQFVEEFRAHFGDERASYQDALDRHYAEGPPVDWQQNFVSAYASMHPWEDWAETWAHFLHIVDTLETYQSFSMRSEIVSDSLREVRLPFSVYGGLDGDSQRFDAVLKLWIDATVVLNSLNRSMGLPDPYPFVLHETIQTKLHYIHNAVVRFNHGRSTTT